MPESRLSARATFFAEVDVLRIGDALPRRVWGKNLSENGIFLQTTHNFAEGERVSLRFRVGDEAVLVRAAEVVWNKRFEPVAIDGMLPGVGLRFVAVDAPARSAIRNFVVAAPIAPKKVPTPVPEVWHQSVTPERVPTIPYGAGKLNEISEGPYLENPSDVETITKAASTSVVDELPGWVFEKQQNATVSMRNSVPPPPVLDDSFVDVDVKSALPEFDLSEFSLAPILEADATIVDEAPEPWANSLPPDESISNVFFDNEFSNRPTQIAAASIASERSVVQLERSLKRRRTSPYVAAAVLAAGACVGVFFGAIDKPTAPVQTAEVVLPSEPPRSVAEVEAELQATRDALQPTASKTVAPTPKKIEVKKQEVKKAKADIALTSALPPKTAPAGKIAFGKVAVPLHGGHITRTFGLQNPARVVIDLAGATYPGAKTEVIGEKGVAKIRIGKPDKEHVRVVVELSRQQAPRNISAVKRKDSIVIAWK